MREGRPHIVDMIKNDEIDLIVNTTEGKQAIRESNSIRREAVHHEVTYYTTLAARARDLRGARPRRRRRRESSAGPARGGCRHEANTHDAARRRGAARRASRRLKSEARPNVIKAIAEARAHGDLSENAEYHAAREQQGFIEGRIREIEAKLGNAEIIDHRAQRERQGRVRLDGRARRRRTDGTGPRYQIVGEDEADIRAGRCRSPRRSRARWSASPKATWSTSRRRAARRSYEITSVEYI